MSLNFDEQAALYLEMIEKSLTTAVPTTGEGWSRLRDAAMHSVGAGGKRIRPILTLEFCRLLGGDIEKALPAATAIELIHTASLIHDDLPCMDDDDMRRGKPSCHKAFDEATALLAGDLLMVLPFGIISRAVVEHDVKPSVAVAQCAVLAGYFGENGVIGGQQLDLSLEGKEPSEKQLLDMYRMKTSDLLCAAAVMGCLAAEAGEKELSSASEYAMNMGLAFQIIDDILDITGDEKTLGKPIGSDAAEGKVTIASLLGVEKARKKADFYSARAKAALSSLPSSGFLMELTDRLLNRSN